MGNQNSIFNRLFFCLKEVVITIAGIIIFFVSSQNIFAQLNEEFQVNTQTFGAQISPSVAADNEGNFVVTWPSVGQDGDGMGIVAQRFDKNGAKIGSEFVVNSTVVGSQSGAAIAMDDDGDFVIVWISSPVDPFGVDIYGQCFDKTGNGVGGEFIVNTYRTDIQTAPSVAMNGAGDFVVAWQSNLQDGDDWGIYAQRYNMNGVAQGVEFRANSFTQHEQSAPAVSMANTGDFIISWQSYGQDGYDQAVYARCFDSDGVAKAVEFNVGGNIASNQGGPSIDIDTEGDFIIAWSGGSIEDMDFDVYVKRYNSDGTIKGDAQRVNTYTIGQQVKAFIKTNDIGEFVITWLSDGQDGDLFGVYAQCFNNIGVVLGREFQVNQYTTNYQSNESIAMSAAGEFVVTWLSIGQDGDQGGIYARYFVNQDPLISDQNFTVEEKNAINAAIGTVVASDPDVNAGQDIVYAITGGNIDNMFAINAGTGELTVAGVLDYATISSYNLIVEARDTGIPGKSASATVVIMVTEVISTDVHLAGGVDTELKIYPNPAKDEVYVNMDGLIGIRIKDLSGHILRELSTTNSRFSISDIPSGIYIVEISQKGLKATQKLIVE